MVEFEVNDMTCGHCVATITEAVEKAAPGAVLAVDLPRRVVRVEGTPSPAVVEQAIRAAGYTPSLRT